jgi:hypothetical protein
MKLANYFPHNVDGCCLRSHNEDVSDAVAEIGFDKCGTTAIFNRSPP